MYALWWLDPFRIRRLPALACKLACLAALVGYSFAWPDEAWRGYYDDGYLSKFAAPASPRSRTSSITASWNPTPSPPSGSRCRWWIPAIPPAGGRTSS
jgi:hypothetical protein